MKDDASPLSTQTDTAFCFSDFIAETLQFIYSTVNL